MRRRLLLYVNMHNDQAKMALRRAIEAYPGAGWTTGYYADVHRLLGLALAGQNRLTDAIGYLEKAVEINPANTWAHIHYGKALYFCSPDQIDLTVAQFDQALQLEPEVDIWQNLIQFWKSVGNQEEVRNFCLMAKSLGFGNQLIIECSNL